MCWYYIRADNRANVEPTMRRFLTLTVYAGVASSLRVRDPGDTISPALWAGDNALFADYRGASEAQPRALTVCRLFFSSVVIG